MVILVVSEDAGLQSNFQEWFGDTCEVIDTTSTPEARFCAEMVAPDLVVADLRTDGEEWPEVRRTLQKQAEPYPLPFVFVVTDESVATVPQLATDGPVVIMGPTPSMEQIAHLVTSLVSSAERREGMFADQTLDPLLTDIADHGSSGVLVVYQGSVIKKLVFRGGELAAWSSSDPQDRLELPFLRAGLLSEREWIDASSEHPDASTEELLARFTSISDEEFRRITRARAREALLDLYLWSSGKWVYRQGDFGVPGGTPVRIGLEEVRAEGHARAGQWPFLSDLFLKRPVTFAVHSERYPPEMLTTADDRRFFELAQAGFTLRQTQLELLESDFEICARCHELLKAGAISIVSADATPTQEPPPEDVAVSTLMEEAEDAFDQGDLRRAQQLYLDVLEIDPTHAKAHLGLQEVAKEATSSARLAGLVPDQKICLAIEIAELAERKPTPREAFVFSRLAAGPLRVKDLVRLCPFEESEVLDVLQKASREGVIKLA